MSVRCGFIGLGKMGKAIAGNLAPKGLETVVFDVVPEPVADLVQGGAKAASSPAEVGAGADVIGVCVPADSHVREVLLGDAGVLANASRGSVICIHSTVHPETIDEIALAAAPLGIDVLDVPVAGGPVRVEAGDAYFMVGGDEAAFEKAKPYLAASAPSITYCGALGNASKLKLAINVHTNICFASAFEAARLTRQMGLPQELFEEAGEIVGTLNAMMLQFLGLHKAPDEMARSEAMQGHLKQSMELARKDLSLALDMGRECDAGMPVTGVVSQLVARTYRVESDSLR